jgi:hypothetical protein
LQVVSGGLGFDGLNECLLMGWQERHCPNWGSGCDILLLK